MNKLHLLLITLCSTTLLTAQTITDAVIDTIASRNLQLRADSIALKAEHLERSAENQPEGLEISGDMLFGIDRRWSAEVSQQLDWPGLYGARRNALNVSHQQANAIIDARTRALRLDALALLIQLAEARQCKAQLLKIHDNVESIESLADSLLSHRAMTALDRRKLTLEHLSLHSRLAEIESSEVIIIAQLQQMGNNIRPSSFDGITELPTMELMPLNAYTQNIDSSLPVAESRANEAIAQADARAQKLRRAPGFTIGYLHEFEENTHFNGFKVGINLPAYGSGKNAHSAKLKARAAAILAEDTYNQHNAELTALHAQATELNRLLAQYAEAMADDDYIHLLTKSLQGGQITMMDFLQETNWYASTNIEYISLKAKLLQFIILLNKG